MNVILEKADLLVLAGVLVWRTLTLTSWIPVSLPHSRPEEIRDGVIGLLGFALSSRMKPVDGI